MEIEKNDTFFGAVMNNDIDKVKQYLDYTDDLFVKCYDFNNMLNILYNFKEYEMLKLLILSNRICKKDYNAEWYLKLKSIFTEEDLETLNFEYIISIL